MTDEVYACNLKRTRLVWFVDALCAVLLVGFAISATSY